MKKLLLPLLLLLAGFLSAQTEQYLFVSKGYIDQQDSLLASAANRYDTIMLPNGSALLPQPNSLIWAISQDTVEILVDGSVFSSGDYLDLFVNADNPNPVTLLITNAIQSTIITSENEAVVAAPAEVPVGMNRLSYVGNGLAFLSSPVASDSAGGINYLHPYVDSVSLMANNVTADVNVFGSHFSPTTTFSLPDFNGSINSVSVIRPDYAVLNITAPDTFGFFALVASNGNSSSAVWPPGQDSLQVLSNGGSGPAGLYAEDFETAGSFGNWVNTGDVDWSNFTGSTGSSGTGPSAAGSNARYIYTEASSPAAQNDAFIIQTDYFAELTEVRFLLHKYANNVASMGTLYLEASSDFVTWTEVASWPGVLQANATDPWIEEVVDMTGISCRILRFRLVKPTNDFQSDCGIDNIRLTSQ